jgi:hypothetical protein
MRKRRPSASRDSKGKRPLPLSRALFPWHSCMVNRSGFTM